MVEDKELKCREHSRYQYQKRFNTGCSRRCYRAALAEFRVVPAYLPSEGVFDTRNAADACRYAQYEKVNNEFPNQEYCRRQFPAQQGCRGVKILAIMGSPKGKGSGYGIVKMIEDRMKAMGDMEFAYLFLKDANLKPCTGCYTCMAKGEDKCPLKDDRAAIEQKLLAADGVILSSPMYVLNVSWLMKNFIDRFAYTNHRPRFHHQKVLTVVNMGGDSPKATLSFLRNALGGSRIVHELGIATPPWMQTERAVVKKERAIDAAAKKFYRACLDTSLPSVTLHSLILFLVRQKIYLECRQVLPADYAYYNGKAYYYDTNINPIKAAVAKAIVGVMMNRMKDMGPGNIPWPVAKKEE